MMILIALLGLFGIILMLSGAISRSDTGEGRTSFVVLGFILLLTSQFFLAKRRSDLSANAHILGLNPCSREEEVRFVTDAFLKGSPTRKKINKVYYTEVIDTLSGETLSVSYHYQPVAAENCTDSYFCLDQVKLHRPEGGIRPWEYSVTPDYKTQDSTKYGVYVSKNCVILNSD